MRKTIYVLLIALIVATLPVTAQTGKQQPKKTTLAIELHLRADSLLENGQYTDARKEYYRALELKEGAGDTLGAALCRLGLAQIALVEGYYTKSMENLNRIQPALESAKLLPQLYTLHMTRGEALNRRFLYRESTAEFNAASEIALKMRNPHKAFLASEKMGKLSLQGKRDEAALLHFSEALLKAPDRADSSRAYNGLARALTLRKDYPAAISYFDSATVIASSPPDTLLLAEIYGARGDMNRRREDYKGAVKYLSMQLELVKSQGDELRRARIMTNLAVILEKQKQVAWALELMEEAVRILEKRKSPEADEAREFLKRLREK